VQKIALEEHFGLPELPQYYAVGQFGFRKADADDLNHRLQEFDDLRLKAMEEGGISKQILGHSGPGIQAAQTVKQAVSDAKRINDFLAAQVRRHPDKFGGFATVPLLSPEDAADELERCIRQLGFHGVMIDGHTHGHYLDEERYRVFWERLVDLDVPIYLHPTNAWQIPQNYQDHPELLGSLWGWTPETATHLLRLILAGVFDRFPTAQVIIGHGGEALPYWLWRLDTRLRLNHFETVSIRNNPSEYMRKNVFVTTSGLFHTPPLRCALETIGEDRIMFSVDYPFESSEDAGNWLDGVDLPTSTKEKIAYGNAKRLLRITD